MGFRPSSTWARRAVAPCLRRLCPSLAAGAEVTLLCTDVTPNVASMLCAAYPLREHARLAAQRITELEGSRT